MERSRQRPQSEVAADQSFTTSCEPAQILGTREPIRARTTRHSVMYPCPPKIWTRGPMRSVRFRHGFASQDAVHDTVAGREAGRA
ncbi:hypothetical protein ADK52_14475 [Streptomyces sp. WM6372]|nr:hypothetical protein ADK52_14475 [Streptomyces sp. WM6372]